VPRKNNTSTHQHQAAQEFGPRERSSATTMKTRHKFEPMASHRLLVSHKRKWKRRKWPAEQKPLESKDAADQKQPRRRPRGSSTLAGGLWWPLRVAWLLLTITQLLCDIAQDRDQLLSAGFVRAAEQEASSDLGK
jgi:hypothetical protein